MSSNLPPGCTEGMIPGNRPEDADWEAVIDWLGSLPMSAGEVRDVLVAFLKNWGETEGRTWNPKEVPVLYEDKEREYENRHGL